MIVLVSSFLLSSCFSPRLNYLGDVYAPTSEVDVFYDPGDIPKRYKVIGKMNTTNASYLVHDIDKTRQDMIEKAKLKGAEGILFLYVETLPENQYIVHADLIKYKS